MKYLSIPALFISFSLSGCGAPGRLATPGDIAYVRLTWYWFGENGEASDIGVPRDVHLSDMKVVLRGHDGKKEYATSLEVIGEASVVITETKPGEKFVKPGDGLAGRCGIIKIPEKIENGSYDVCVVFNRQGKKIEACCDTVFVQNCEVSEREALPKLQSIGDLKRMRPAGRATTQPPGM